MHSQCHTHCYCHRSSAENGGARDVTLILVQRLCKSKTCL